MRHDGVMASEARGASRIPWWGVGLVAILAAIGVVGFTEAIRQAPVSGSPTVIRLPAPAGAAATPSTPAAPVKPSTSPSSSSTVSPSQSTVVIANRTVVTEVAGQVATTLPPSPPPTTAPSPSTTTTTHEDQSGPTTTEPHDHLRRAG